MATHVWSDESTAGDRILPRSVDQLDEPGCRPEVLVPLSGARVVWADHDGLRRDFAPQLGQAPAEEIDAWLLALAAVISRSQLAGTAAPVATGDGAVHAVRPPRYGRSVVVDVGANRPRRPPPGGGGRSPAAGLLDVKGVGTEPGAAPSRSRHSDGTLHLDELFYDLLRQALVQSVLTHSGVDVAGVAVYALIDAGYDCSKPWRSAVPRPAGIMVRRAHRRNRGNAELPPAGTVAQAALLAIELILRSYGITSAIQSPLELRRSRDGFTAALDGEPITGVRSDQLAELWRRSGDGAWTVFEGVNVQTTRGIGFDPLRAELVDFGHYRVKAHFTRPLVSLVSDRPLGWGGVLLPDSEHFVQPVPTLAIPAAEQTAQQLPADVVDGLRLGPDDTLSPLYAVAVGLTESWRRRELANDAVAARIDAAVAALTGAWPSPARPESSSRP